MAEIIAVTTDYAERVRALLHAEKELVPDSMINSYDFSEIAEIAIKSSVPMWEEILAGADDNKIQMLCSALVYQTAIYLFPEAQKVAVKIQQTTHAKVEYFENGADMLIDSLLEKLSMLLLMLNGERSRYHGFDISNPDKRYYGGDYP